MRWIHETCDAEIREVTGGDRHLGALLAALTANESGGCRQAYRFAPSIHERLLGLLSGSQSKVDGLTRAQLEKRLSGIKCEAERSGLLKQLAGLHGYTHLPGYLSIGWKVDIAELTDKARHFQFAAQRLEQICREFDLNPASQAAEVGRRWSAGHAEGRTRAAMYSWRLVERMRLYVELA